MPGSFSHSVHVSHSACVNVQRGVLAAQRAPEAAGRLPVLPLDWAGLGLAILGDSAFFLHFASAGFVMFGATFRSSRTFRLCRWCCAAVVGACVGLSGCADVDLRGDRFQYDPIEEWAGTLRPPDRQTQPFAFTNKGRQIEKDFGIQ
jgi:hypothetical protein